MYEQQNIHTITIKVIVFSIIENALKVYLPSRELPRCSLLCGNTLEQEMQSLLEKHTLQKAFGFSEQLYSQNDERNPQNIDIVYYKLIEQQSIPSQLVSDWTSISELDIYFKEHETLMYALQRLQWKIEYTNIVYSLLPDEFTLSQLQGVYEAILGKTLDKRNFRKKIVSLGMLQATGEKKLAGRARPAELYTFLHKQLSFVEIL